jgi:hypothetical protein
MAFKQKMMVGLIQSQSASQKHQDSKDLTLSNVSTQRGVMERQELPIEASEADYKSHIENLKIENARLTMEINK